MRKPTVDGGFWFSFALNLAMNFEGAIAAVVLFVCHFAFGIPLWVPLAVLGLWFGGIFAVTLALSVLTRDAPSNDAGNGFRNQPSTRFSSRGDGQQFDQERKGRAEEPTDLE